MTDKLPPTPDERCGTSAGYQAHFRRSETPCNRCRESHLEDCRAYHEDNREAALERRRAYYAANREAFLKRRRAYREANREAVLEYDRAYREANREHVADRERERDARLREAFEPVALHADSRWTPEDDAIIRATYDEPAVLAAALARRTPKAVAARRFRLRKQDAAARLEVAK